MMTFKHGQTMPEDMAKAHGLEPSEWIYCRYRGDFFRYDVVAEPDDEMIEE